MILIGMYDSPFVRRVAIAMHQYGIGYEHRPWSVFGDADRIAPFNPLIRVPVLVLDEGDVLIESYAILDALDQQAGPARALIPASEAARREALKGCALSTGLADKAVSLVYERVLHAEMSPVWAGRCVTQIESVLDTLEADRRRSSQLFWFGPAIGHADIALACALRFTFEAHPALRDDARWPTLAAHAVQCEALEAFRQTAQPFSPPAS